MYWRRKWQPTPVFLPRESQRQRSLVGCHLCAHTGSDTTEVTQQQQQQQQVLNILYISMIIKTHDSIATCILNWNCKLYLSDSVPFWLDCFKEESKHTMHSKFIFCYLIFGFQKIIFSHQSWIFVFNYFLKKENFLLTKNWFYVWMEMYAFVCVYTYTFSVLRVFTISDLQIDLLFLVYVQGSMCMYV